ncbi:MAG: Holliday junction branch migration protein RuvA [Planctomyces sp.]|jgi:Holliday junction DNA helicase RuvA|nr:helix-hairpin-helix domain-containing protein [Planctomyces sp.]GDX91973.1 Holliday junction ATP-dependent DNA helicase RuvA [Planctomycetia bacterium]HAV31309.1 Holliday junction DNA helicase RuvA [Planctomycetaceae bacterium]HBC60180.1 Holliday junction DNA helicase RuvA [Planctomycetaceae bacterium]
MINRITGQLVAINETHASIRIGGLDYEVLLPDVVRRQLQSKLNSEVSLRAIEYLEGNPQQGRMVPRIVGFMNDAELEFFELFCSVDGVGVKKALRAMVRPVREIAVSIEEQDAKGLSALPGIGPAMAERIIAKLRRRMTRFALMIASRVPDEADPKSDLVSEAYEALLSVGHSPQDARERIETVVQPGRKFKSVEDILTEIYQKQRR